MKIVHVIGGYLPDDLGGTQIHLRDLCRMQRKSGHKVHILARQGGRERDEYTTRRDRHEGVPVTRITHNFLDCDRFDRIFSNPVIDDAFRRFLKAERADVVHVHHLSGLSVSMIEVAREQGCGVVMTLQDYWLQCPRGQRIYPPDLSVCETLDRRKCHRCLHDLVPDLLPAPETRGWPARLVSRDPGMTILRSWEADMLRWLNLCDRAIAPSSSHRDRFVEWGLAPDRVTVVPHGLSREQLLAEPRGGRPIEHVGFIGTVIPSKGVHILVEAWNLLGRRDLVLDVHGEAVPFFDRTSYLEDLEAMVVPGLQVRFHGRYENEDLPRVLAGLDLLVVPPLWWETYCLTAREGALAGLPVIVSRTGGIAEAIEEGTALGFRGRQRPGAGCTDRTAVRRSGPAR